jgi:protein-L-isoaspartate(D-aspartate) O-methyltransferase
MKPMTEKHLAILRRHMVEIVEMHFDLASDEIGTDGLDPALRRALLEVPRHVFVPSSIAGLAYQDGPLPIGFDKTISQPFIGALMLQLAGIAPGLRVLEIGTGLGYQATLMAEMGAQVFSIEVVEEFAEAAEERFKALGHDIRVKVGDGSRGWPEHEPYDRIIVTAAAAEAPQELVDELAPGGRMVIPLGGQDVQLLSVIEKDDQGAVAVRPFMPVRFTQLELLS